MLQHLSISNYVLISSLEIDFTSGFSVITGETGAGKSILLGALGLVMGQRADTKAISQGMQKCVIEATFDLAGYRLESFFLDNDLDYDERHCTIRRELGANGKSRSFVNDTPVSLATLKELTTHLIDIHSQHENLLLADGRFQLDIIDTIAANSAEQEAYRVAYRVYTAALGKLEELRLQTARRQEDADYIRFQYAQLLEADLKPDELSEIEAEMEVLSHTEEITENLGQTLALLEDEEKGILSALKTCTRLTQKTMSHMADLQSQYDRLESAYIELKDIAGDLSDRYGRIEYDPARLEWLGERADLIRTLLQKHRVADTVALIEVRDQYAAQLEVIDNSDELLRVAEQELDAARQALEAAGAALTATRRKAKQPIEQCLVEQLKQLGIAHPQIDISITPLPQPADTGMDNLQILFAANKNQVPRNVAEVASGGEIARLMLCLKALLAEHQALPTLIFDEIDTGVSGEVADRMGNIMQQMGNNMQVMTITHLPQIAAKGKMHYKVYKHDSEQRTETQIKSLSGEERIREIAQMLSGAAVTDAAIENAKHLLQK